MANRCQFENSNEIGVFSCLTNGYALCAIGGSGDGGCKIWFSGQEWADGSHEMVVIGPDGDVVESFTVNLGEASSGDARTGMVQIIALMGMVICLGAYLWLRQRKE